MDDFYYEENSKHVFLKCLGILFILGLIIGGFIFYKNTNTLRLRKVTLELGSKLSNNVSDYLIGGKKISEYKLYLDNVDTESVGTYTYKIKYNKHTKSGHIVIKDTTNPEIVPNEITLKKGDVLNSNDLIVKCDDFSKPCKVNIITKNIDDLLSVTGEYNIEYYVSDSFGNKTKGITKVIVSDTEETSSLLSNDLVYSSNSLNDDTIEHIYFKKLDKAIKDDSSEYDDILANIALIDFTTIDPEIYKTETIVVYNKYGYIIGFQVLATYTNGTTNLLKESVNLES